MAREYLSKQGYWRLFRFLNAAHLLAYVGIEAGYDETNLFGPFNEKYVLLTAKEVLSIKEIGFGGESAYLEVLTWALSTLKHEYENGLIPERTMVALIKHCFRLRKTLAKFFEYSSLPVPFSYVQLYSVMTFCFLPLFAHSVAYSYQRQDSSGKSLSNMVMFRDSIVEFGYVLTYTLLVLSLRTLARDLQDPFGHNLEDISVGNILQITVAGSSRVLCAQPVRPKYPNPACYFFQRALLLDEADFDDIFFKLNDQSTERPIKTGRLSISECTGLFHHKYRRVTPRKQHLDKYEFMEFL